MSGSREKKPERKVPAELRYGKRSVDETRELIRTIKLLIRRIEGALDSAEKLKLKELKLDGVTKGDRALTLLKGFAANIEHSARRAEYGDL